MKRRALISVSDKQNLPQLAKGLSSLHFEIVASGGTSHLLRSHGVQVTNVSSVTGAQEMLGGRVKTLHPSIHGGILARRSLQSDRKDMQERQIEYFDVVVCNLYPFQQRKLEESDLLGVEGMVEEVDIGGVALIRAAAKNHARVVVVCDPTDYQRVLEDIKRTLGTQNSTSSSGLTDVDDDGSGSGSEGGEMAVASLELRRSLAVKAFEHTANYDTAISDYFRKQYSSSSSSSSLNGPVKQLNLRYGMNPHQSPSQVFSNLLGLPFKVLNGAPGYINLLDALNAWPLVRELKEAFKGKYAAAASFKHVSPAGCGVSVPLAREEYEVLLQQPFPEPERSEGSELAEIGSDGNGGLSDVAVAYARARGSDRMSSFGDFIALSEECDLSCALLISREVSDGIIAPSYSAEALEVLKKKKGGRYCVLQVEEGYVPDGVERRSVFGVVLEQKRNDAKITPADFTNIITLNGGELLSEEAKRDMTLATLALKYTQSNSVCYAQNGQTIGLGAGQQSRIHCTRLAGDKADAFYLRFHPRVRAMQFKKGVKRADKANAIDLYVTGSLDFDECGEEVRAWEAMFEVPPVPLSKKERKEWLSQRTGVVVASDAFFPFTDNVHRAARSGVKYLVAPGGSVQDEEVVKCALGYGMTVVRTPWRLFHH